MTAKRFQIIHLGNPYDFVVKDHQTNRTYGTLQGDDKSLMELLNKLHEEVQSQSIVIKGYQDRNEILNQQIYDKNKILLTEIEINENLHDENNRIKQTIQDMMETERTELGKSVLKQLYEAIQ